MNNVKYTFFGSSRFSVIVLDEMERAGYIPTVIVTTPTKPQGRKMVMTPTPVKTWALAHHIPVLEPAKLDDSFMAELRSLEMSGAPQATQLFVVASYGKIIPQSVINIPKYRVLNIHPSLLPKYRGASPLQSAMLDDAKATGVTVMRVDKEMDHGPIVAQKEVSVTEWPIYEEFEELMAREGARLLVEVIPKWLAGEIKEKEQDHTQATLTRKITKEDGLIEIGVGGRTSVGATSVGATYADFRKIQAFHEWPQAYFMIDHGGKQIRVKITKASYVHNRLIIEKVIPEGSREMSYQDFKQGYLK